MLFLKAMFILILIVGVLPLVYGLPFRDVLAGKSLLSRVCFCYVLGFLFSISFFELLCVPMTYLRCAFDSFVYVYTVLILAGGLLVGAVGFKKRINGIHGEKDIRRMTDTLICKVKSMTKWEWLYLFMFFSLVLYQIYGAIHYSVTYSSLDDAEYIVYSTDAVDNNRMFSINTQTGVYAPFSVKRTFQSSLLYYGYIAKLTGLSVAVIAHTVCCVLFLVMAYMVYWVMAEDIFEKRENRYIFLFLTALMFMMGNYSNYSLSFRLLGPNWQGKAVLSVVVVPLLFVIMHQMMGDKYRHRYGQMLMILSCASVSLSLMGVGTLLITLSCVMCIGAVLKKRADLLLYILWGGALPAFVGGVYLLEHM